MTKAQENKLDKMFQVLCLERWNHRSILSGKRADVVHHFFGRANKATRWYLPNGIPLTDEEHKLLEWRDRANLEKVIVEKLGTLWYEDLVHQSNRIAKYLNVQLVKSHLKGEAPHYLDGWYM